MYVEAWRFGCLYSVSSEILMSRGLHYSNNVKLQASLYLCCWLTLSGQTTQVPCVRPLVALHGWLAKEGGGLRSNSSGSRYLEKEGGSVGGCHCGRKPR